MSRSSTSSSEEPAGAPAPAEGKAGGGTEPAGDDGGTTPVGDDGGTEPAGGDGGDTAPAGGDGGDTAPAGDNGGKAPSPLLSAAGRRALLLCVTILLVLEIGVARTDWIWKLDPRRPVGIMLAVEEQIVVPVTDARVVMLGSSVMRDAMLPAIFEQTAGLPGGSALNVSLPNATPFDFVLLYERNRELLRGARLLIVGIEDWYFYEEPGVSERYHRWASLGERWTDYRGGERLPLLVSWAWQTYAARRAFALDGLGAAFRGERADVVGEDRRVRWRPEEIESGPARFDLSSYEARLGARAWRDRQVRYLGELLGLAAEDGVAAVLVRMPMRGTAFALRAEVDPAAEQRLQEAITAARSANAAAAWLDYPTAADAGLEDADFLDERHLGSRGATTFTRRLATWAAGEHDLR